MESALSKQGGDDHDGDDGDDDDDDNSPSPRFFGPPVVMIIYYLLPIILWIQASFEPNSSKAAAPKTKKHSKWPIIIMAVTVGCGMLVIPWILFYMVLLALSACKSQDPRYGLMMMMIMIIKRMMMMVMMRMTMMMCTMMAMMTITMSITMIMTMKMTIIFFPSQFRRNQWAGQRYNPHGHLLPGSPGFSV